MFSRSIKIVSLSALVFAFFGTVEANDAAKLFKKDVGTWDCEVKVYSDPSSPPAVSKGVETNIMIGEHWLISHFKGSVMGADFEGSSQNGYDANTSKFIGTWIDSMSPHSMKTEGTWDEKTQTLTSSGVSKDPTGTEMKNKMTVVYKSDGTRNFTMFAIVNAAEVKMMEIKYTKAADKSNK